MLTLNLVEYNLREVVRGQCLPGIRQQIEMSSSLIYARIRAVTQTSLIPTAKDTKCPVIPISIPIASGNSTKAG